MELLTTNYTENEEIMTKISLIDCGREVDHFLIYNNAEENRAKPLLQKTAREIQYFIERIYDYGRKQVPIDFKTIEIPMASNTNDTKDN